MIRQLFILFITVQAVFGAAARDLLAKIKAALVKPAPTKPPTLEDVERSTILQALRNSDGNLSRAADELGITRQSLYRRIEKLGL